MVLWVFVLLLLLVAVMFSFEHFAPVKRLARKFVSNMTRNVSSWTLNPTELLSFSCLQWSDWGCWPTAVLSGGRSDLTEVADLFVRNAITGKSLLLLTVNDLHDLGVQSVGHVVEIYVSVLQFQSTYYWCSAYKIRWLVGSMKNR